MPFKNAVPQSSAMRLLSNFRMRTQILIINGCILILVMSLIVATQQINTYLLSYYAEESQLYILYKQNQNHIESIMSSFDDQITFYFERTHATLASMNRLYRFTTEIKSVHSQEPQLCYPENEESIYPEDKNYPLMCLSIFNLPFSYTLQVLSQQSDFTRFIHFLNEYVLAYDVTQSFLPDNFYIASDDALEITAFWPQWERVNGYHPHQRIWYKDHKGNYSQDPLMISQVSDLYEYFASYPVVAMTATHTLTRNGTFEGVIASDIELQARQFMHPTLNFMLVNQDGRLIITNYKSKVLANSTSSPYFFENEITGFSREDWNQIQLFINGTGFSSNCQYYDTWNSDSKLCRLNSLYQQDVVLAIRSLGYPKYVLIVFNNLTIDQEYILQSRRLIFELENAFYNLLSITSIAIIILIAIQILIVWLLFRPLYMLIMHSKIHIKSNSNKLLFRQKEYYLQSLQFSSNFGSSILQRLKQSYTTIFQRMCSQSKAKSSQCLLFQKYQYPRRVQETKIQIPDFPEIPENCLLDLNSTIALIKAAFVSSMEQK